MKRLLLTQRVLVDSHGERRDALDQRWAALLESQGWFVLALPNSLARVEGFIQEFKPHGVILTGGNSLSEYGGDAPERDRAETSLLDFCRAEALPVLFVCRGMQMLQHYLGGALEPVDGHVTASMTIDCDGRPRNVNSYHTFGFRTTVDGLKVWARAEDGVIKAVRHAHLPWVGVMWHPERRTPADAEDITLLQEMFA